MQLWHTSELWRNFVRNQTTSQITWSKWIANDVPEAKQAAALLSAIGSKPYSTLKNLLAPDLPSSKSFEALKNTLKSHYDPKPSVIGQRFKFHRRKQNPSESIADFSTALRRIAIDCNFGASLEDSLRDQFVSGLLGEAMHKRLLTEDKLTLKRAIEIATGVGGWSVPLVKMSPRTFYPRANCPPTGQNVPPASHAVKVVRGIFDRMATEEEEYDAVFCFLRSGHDPAGFSKRALRRKATNNYKVKKDQLLYCPRGDSCSRKYPVSGKRGKG